MNGKDNSSVYDISYS